MDKISLFILARAIHVLCVVLWIGGVAFVTTVLIPAIKKLETPEQRLKLFETLEGRFALQAKLTTLLTVITGVYMIEVLNAWGRFLEPQYWWMHLMTAIWLVFTLVLFVLEPLFLHRWFQQKALINSDQAFKRLHTMHWVLLSLSLLAALGAVLGSHGFSFGG